MEPKTIAILVGVALVAAVYFYGRHRSKKGSGSGKGPGKVIDNPK
jgi:hypothetical protein